VSDQERSSKRFAQGIVGIVLALMLWNIAQHADDPPVELEHPPTCNRMVCD
jgi:hypothetical protein